MSEDQLYSRVMRCLLANAAIEQLGSDGLLVVDERDVAERDTLTPLIDNFSGRVMRAARQMVPLYAIYFCFENAVREFVAETMRDAHGDAWFDKVPLRIKQTVESRKKQLETNKWFTYQPLSDVSQLLFGDLGSIITDQWAIFRDFFPGQDWVKVRLNELEMSRNVIAHANELPGEEIDRISRYLADWQKQVPS